MIPVCCSEVIVAEELRHCHHLPFTIVVGAFERQEGLLYVIIIATFNCDEMMSLVIK